jgi:flagellar hook-basal body complex protein FliE
MIGALALADSLLTPTIGIASAAMPTIDIAAGVAKKGLDEGKDFTQVLAQVSNDAIGKLKTAESSAISGIQGKASVQQVVESVMSAEQTLQTAVAVRDKVISAYQEISRMSI